MPSSSQASRGFGLAVLIAALGYFVDIYDLVLFNVIRKPSLEGIGLHGDELLSTGIYLLDMQMAGMLLGGIFWGVLGDKRGRISVLFGSILLYSLANIANGFVTSVGPYAFLRFAAGVGLAGELGAGITLVSESMHRESRGYGTTVVATIGITGAVAAALVGDFFSWRVAYFVGGGLGLSLLLLRVGAYESGMFEAAKKKADSRGNFFRLFATWDRARRYLCVILVGVPIWYGVAILTALSPEIGKAMGMTTVPNAGRAIMFCYIGLAAGDFASGAMSQVLRSRKKVLYGFVLLTAAFVAAYFAFAGASVTAFYTCVTLVGFGAGYWAVFVTVASEQFGTNLRATATTTAPNFVRGSVVLVTLLFKTLKDRVGIVRSAEIVGAIVLALAFVALSGFGESYGKDLDFVED
jgi:MFS family permease